MKTLTQIKELMNNLELSDLYELDRHLAVTLADKNDDFIKTLEENTVTCPHCKKKEIIIWGNYNGNKRYKCKSCGRTFTCTTGSVLHNLKNKDKFIKYSSLMFSSRYPTIKELAFKTGISIETSIQWRHRLLISLGQESPKFSGITELDDIWFLYSQKGRKGLKFSRKRGGSKRQGDNNFQAKVVITKERGADLDMSLVRIGRIKKDDLKRKLSGKFKKNAILVSDKHRSIHSFAKSENIKHKTFRAKDHVKDKIIHVQTVNNLANQLKTIVNYNFRGVSTKYLQNYATWFSIKERYKNTKDKVLNIINLALSNKSGWDMYTNIEKFYENFILNYSVRTYRCKTKKSWKYQNWNFENAKIGVFL